MQIKTITCHNVYNHGASLQAYALSKYMTTLGHTVEIINYIPDYLEHYVLWGHVSQRFDRPLLREAYCVIKFPGRLNTRLTDKRKKAFDRFTKDFLPLTSHYSSYEDLCEDPPVADLFIAGSDQIWNTSFSNGKDPAFYLQFVESRAVKASYAASFATDSVPSEMQNQITTWLKTFDSISVREKSGLSVLAQLGVCNGKQVLDPVFLLSKEEWERMIPASPVQSPYMLYYGFDGNEEAELGASRFAHENGCKLVNALGGRYSDIDCWEAGPLEFLALLRDADTVLSSSFHATAFSLIFEKNFQIFKRKSAINSRMLDLLRTVGLEEHLVDNYGFRRVETDFTTPRRLLNYEIQKSKDYLQSVLSLAEARVEH